MHPRNTVAIPAAVVATIADTKFRNRTPLACGRATAPSRVSTTAATAYSVIVDAAASTIAADDESMVSVDPAAVDLAVVPVPVAAQAAAAIWVASVTHRAVDVEDVVIRQRTAVRDELADCFNDADQVADAAKAVF